MFKRLMALDEYISKIAACQRDAREQGKRREGKESCLRKLLEERGLDKIQNIQTDTEWVPMPLDPTIKLNGLTPSTASMFASAVYPCVIEFHEVGYDPQRIEDTTAKGAKSILYESNPLGKPSATASSGSLKGTAEPGTSSGKTNKELLHKIMFKTGDDLRQDQLVMQMISLMDRLLKKVNLDLKLLTYGILATGPKDGIMEFCKNSAAVSGALKKHGSLAEYLRVHNADPSAPYGISPVALDTFVKSCAGSCVVTYILGIGDRHLDNIMVNTSGQMFHIDFGFIFGQDPKPMPPPFRLTRAMVDCMGGEDSQDYVRFKTYCCQAYNWLRKSASLIINLLSLMGDAGIQDISKRSDLSKVLMKVEEKFRLDLTDEQAEQFFLGLVNESLNAIAPRLMEKLHEVAVSMR
jgi:phosphatidylinositol 3-kinase